MAMAASALRNRIRLSNEWISSQRSLNTPFTLDRKDLGCCAESYLFNVVTPGHVSVRNGDAGNSSLLYKLHSGLSAQA